ncbi:MAG: NTP transferase domain-containing protein [Proteobacteria bacterium]|nr:NTP transferase domain-containing protein [Pseudomonadota bacterium]
MEIKKDPVLVILAGGMGSRYGGNKQLDGVGPHGETLMEYSLFDAKRAGFKEILFIIKREIEEIFKNQILKKFQSFTNISYLFQEVEDLPAGFSSPSDRVKPWGTGQAVLVAKKKIDSPFAVINADDFYGRGAFQVMYDYLKLREVNQKSFCLLTYCLVNTLSLNGSVNRGVCETKNGNLTSIREVHDIHFSQGQLTYDDQAQGLEVSTDSYVSMNFWGFTPAIFPLLEVEFCGFLQQNINDPKSEFYIPSAVDAIRSSGQAAVEVLQTDETWMGVTYRGDKEVVEKGISEAIDKGIYPSPLYQQ